MNPDTHRRRVLITALVGGIVLLLLAGVGIYGLLRGPDHHNHPGTPVSPPGSTSPSPGPSGTTVPGNRLPSLPTTTDPRMFAQAVATALFGWDTTTGLTPLDYSAVILSGADPTGAEANGLASDVRTYLPTPDIWVNLRQYQTKQWLTITTITVPAAWAEAVGQAAPGQILPGTTAYTISGVRHRSGVWNNAPVTSTHDVSFTVFVTCKPSFPACHVLRLSQLDNPLH